MLCGQILCVTSYLWENIQQLFVTDNRDLKNKKNIYFKFGMIVCSIYNVDKCLIIFKSTMLIQEVVFEALSQ